MPRTVYLNGEYLPEDRARVSIFDRGLLFGDGVYEVAGVLDAKLLDFDAHIARLQRSLRELNIPAPLDRDQLLIIFREMIARNNLHEGLVYIQVTRGVAERDFTYADDLQPTVFLFTQAKAGEHSEKAKSGVVLKTQPDIRWARRDIKSINLLAQVLSKQAAHRSGAYEALMVDQDGTITECGATSFFICRDNEIITRPLGNDILPGITRRALVQLCATHPFTLRERRFTLAEALGADEAFISGASSYVIPVRQIDDNPLPGPIPGDIAATLRRIYLRYARDTAI